MTKAQRVLANTFPRMEVMGRAFRVQTSTGVRTLVADDMADAITAGQVRGVIRHIEDLSFPDRSPRMQGWTGPCTACLTTKGDAK